MRSAKLLSLCLIIVINSCSKDGNPNNISNPDPSTYERSNDPSVIKILAIGNSFSEDAIESHFYDLAKAKGARLIIASTSEVYGDPTVHPQTEDYWGNVNPVGPRGVYDEAKRFQEAMTMAYHNFHGLETRIVRIFNTYGPRMRLNDGRVLPAFIGQALRGEDLTVFGDGSQTRSFCYVDDLVEGIVRLLMSDYAQPVNVGNPDEITIKQFAEEIIKNGKKV